jgi:hypothetical protein
MDKKSGLKFAEISEALLDQFSGLLNLSADAAYDSHDLDTIEGLILHADDDVYLLARELFWRTVKHGPRAVFAHINVDGTPTALAAAAAAFSNSLADSRLWASMLLAISLKQVSQGHQTERNAGKMGPERIPINI